jgi:hypothetical protein
MNQELIYIASPYTHPDPEVMEYRYKKVTKLVANMIYDGLYVYSPISSMHPVAQDVDYPLPKDYEYWKTFSKLLLDKSDSMVVYKMDGWKESIGVQDEIKHAIYSNIHIEYLECEQ